MKSYFTIFFIFLFVPYYLMSSIINVPTDQPSIQAGIDASLIGDTVLVADGLYLENINFNGKAIIVASEFLMNDDTSHISATIIDGSQPINPDSGSVVYFTGGTDTTSILSGFTISGGTGNVFTPPGNPTFHYGGGIFIDGNDGARIEWNIIENNIINSDFTAAGGGISSGSPGGPGFTIIEHNTIRNNELIGTIADMDGCGIWMGNNGRIAYNIITGNLSHSINGIARGAVRLSSGDGFPVSSVLVDSNTIKNNQAISDNDEGAVGGFGSRYTILTMINNRIESNIAKGQTICWAAGVHLSRINNTSRIENNVIAKNKCTGVGTGYGGGLIFYNSNPYVTNNTIVDNEATNGGGIGFEAISNPEFQNNIIYGNIAASSGNQVWFWDDNSDPDFYYCDIQGDSSDFGFNSPSYTYTGAYNNNIDDDPLFADSLYYELSQISLCIGAGTDSLAPPFDYDGDPRPNPIDKYVDIGAQESPHANPTGIVKEYTDYLPKAFSLKQNYPNPFNPTTTIEFSIPKSEFVTLKVFNLLGQEVSTLVTEKLTPGEYKYSWDASQLASGMYFYKLETESFSITKKMILLR